MPGGGEEETSFGRWTSVRSCRALLAQGDLEFYSESHTWEAFGGLRVEKPWCWERLKVGRERNNRGWDGWMASPTQWMWVWVNSRSWWWTGRPGVLQSMQLQGVRHNWAIELNWRKPSGKGERDLYSWLSQCGRDQGRGRPVLAIPVRRGISALLILLNFHTFTWWNYISYLFTWCKPFGAFSDSIVVLHI